MKFTETNLPGAYVIDLEKREDSRGFFARAFCVGEFQRMGLVDRIVQINNSLSVERGTLRGLHYQLAPKSETKVIRCLRGRLLDIIVDLRPESPTFCQHAQVELTSENRRMFYVPKGFAHGFLTLEENTEVIYFVDEFYSPEHDRGLRWNDPRFALPWPFEPVVLSDRDRNQRDFDPAWHLGNTGGAAQ